MGNIGVQEAPNDSMIYNRRQADGSFRSLRGFFFPEEEGRGVVKTQVICCVCKKHLQWINTPMGGISHGYCKEHFDEAMSEVEKEFKEATNAEECT